jgi:hypothetical protein
MLWLDSIQLIGNVKWVKERNALFRLFQNENES